MYIIIKLNYYQDKAEKRGVLGRKRCGKYTQKSERQGCGKNKCETLKLSLGKVLRMW